MISVEAEIRALTKAWSKALERKDSAAMLEHYADDAALFAAMGPAPIVGRDAIKAFWEERFPHLPTGFRSEHRDLVIRSCADFAAAYGLHRIVADGMADASWMRVTVIFQRQSGGWRVVHEHVSVPTDPAQAMTPDETHLYRRNTNA